MAIVETAARKLLHGGAIAQGVADVGGISFGLWDLVTGFFSNILSYLFAALVGAAHLLVLPLELLWRWLVTVVVAAAAGAITSGLDGLWQHVTGFFVGIFAALAGAPHLLVLPLEKLWQWLVTSVADAAGTISAGLDGMWQHVTGFFAGIFDALASSPHLLVLPLEKLWQWLVTAAADAAGAISAGLDGMWQHVTGFFAGILAALAGAVHQFVLPLETLWQWLATTTADAAGAISSGLDGLWQLATVFFPGILAHLSAAVAGAAHELAQQLGSLWHWLLTNVADAAGAISFHLDGMWQLVTGFFPKIFAALAGATHELSQKLDELWQWLQAAALPFVLGVAVVLLLVALVRFCGSTLHAVAMGVCKVLVYAICFLGLGLYCIAMAVGRAVACVGRAVACLLPACAQCLRFCAVATMKAPGADGMLISRAAFVANPALYFLLLHAAGPVVASAVFCTVTVARIAAAPVAALFRGPVECA
ncbi:hypothetical protein SEVIR_2G393400v4 [Setaria viridis]|uniref:Uncharacterized protein n=1 Tax=Setaria viridis TaxID=4556 RepID=A0A4U6W2I9_SETVI|nr:uncharacterized protein LOC117842725 [Setaria viridis]TKW35714.1 hypothetical protein SEVIR_2G393400v2 [Setaria viridis]